MLRFLEHFPYASLAGQNEIDSVSGFATEGETVALSFDVEADQDVSDLEFHPLSLTGPNGTIANERIELYVVHIWNQAGIGIYQKAPMLVRELLLKDDRVSLKDGYSRRLKHWRHLVKPYFLYSAPNVRLTGAASTSLKKVTPKQVWISIRVPSHLRAGTYSGELAVTIEGRAVKHIGVTIEVLPFQLDEPEQDRLILYRGKLDWRDSQHHVTESIFRTQLQDILEHGFTSITINEVDREFAQKAIEIAEAIGFKRNLVFMPPFPGEPATLRYESTTPVLYLSDEIDIHIAFQTGGQSDDHILHHRTNWERAQKWKMKSMASIVSQSCAPRFFDEQDIGCVPDSMGYFLARNLDFIHINAHLPDPRAVETYYYWHAHMEKPNLHRVLCGVYLWKSGAAGICPQFYQYMPRYPFSPFDDSDEWEPGFQAGAVCKPFRDHMATYPARHGSIPTLQWEGFREGVTDLRYLVTLENALKRAEGVGGKPAALAHGIRMRLNQFSARIDLREIRINSDTEPEPYEKIEAWEYQEFRQRNARDIMALKVALKTLTGAAQTSNQ